MKICINNIVDLTNIFSDESPTWDGEKKLTIDILNDYDNIFRSQMFTYKGNVGTHLDSPAHVVPHGKTIAELSLDELIRPAYIIYIDTNNADYKVTADDIIAFEKKYELIQKNSWVVFLTGWGEKWYDHQAYRHVDQDNSPRFPQIDVSAANFLVQRGITGIGVDTFSPDNDNTDWQTHKTLLSNNILIIENIKYLKDLPAVGSYLGCFPFLFTNATESPVRVVLFLDDL